MPFTAAQKRAYKRTGIPTRSRARARARPRSYQGRGRYSRARQVYGGKGAYSGKRAAPFSAASGGILGGLAGGLLGPVGGVVGSALGTVAGSALGSIMGWGSYKVKKNSLLIPEGNSPASMHSNNSDIIVTHREYITDIVSSGTANTFQLQSFPINPGLIQSFPWASSICQQFEQYDVLGMIYEFKSLSADAIANTTNTALGYVVMATEYNSILPNFVNKQQAENSQYSSSFKPSESCLHAVECDPHQNPLSTLYVRSGAVPSGTDIRMYDLGNFQIMTSQPGTSVVLGELWCTYQIRLRKPISTNALGQDVLTDHFQINTASAAAPLGTASVARANSSIGGTINAAGTVYSFPSVFQEGMYLVYWAVKGGSVVCTDPSFTVTNGSIISIWENDGGTTSGLPNATTTTRAWGTWVVQITAQSCILTFGTGGTLPSSITAGDLVVTQFDSNIIS